MKKIFPTGLGKLKLYSIEDTDILLTEKNKKKIFRISNNLAKISYISKFVNSILPGRNSIFDILYMLFLKHKKYSQLSSKYHNLDNFFIHYDTETMCFLMIIFIIDRMQA